MRWLHRPASQRQRHAAPADSFALPERRSRLDRISQHTTLPLSSFDQLYMKPLKRYAALVQGLPAHDEPYAYPEGLLDRSLVLIESILMLRRSRLLPPGAAPEDQAQQAEAWSLALTYAVLLTELNRLADTRGNGDGYAQLLDRDILDWLQTFPKIWNQLTAVAAGQLQLAGALGELVGEAHRRLEGHAASTRDRQREEPQGAAAEPANPPDQTTQNESQGLAFLNWLSNLIAQQQLPVNQADAMVHVIDGQAFLCSPALFQHYCRDHQEASPEGGFDDLAWRTIQRSFEALRIHRRRPDGKSIWTYELAWPGHPSRRLSGYLVESDSVFGQCTPNTPQGPNGQAIARV
jgi:hypothetical protein